ncbi:hypothetical protein DUI87_05925 [Hirundo rustica rustica]|uniref:Uncharacterized protein n=1 Tax=Hirundo rustica rustica TaxID=333673 RepID=A0A3M0L0P6_HIRRU|nr:hypothetical protein DUI87_05925 [Hirundo rustica rustica]
MDVVLSGEPVARPGLSLEIQWQLLSTCPGQEEECDIEGNSTGDSSGKDCLKALQFVRIIEWFELEGTLKINSNPVYHGQGHLSVHQGVQCLIRLGVEHSQGWGSHSFSGDLWVISEIKMNRFIPWDAVPGGKRDPGQLDSFQRSPIAVLLEENSLELCTVLNLYHALVCNHLVTFVYADTGIKDGTGKEFAY